MCDIAHVFFLYMKNQRLICLFILFWLKTNKHCLLNSAVRASVFSYLSPARKVDVREAADTGGLADSVMISLFLYSPRIY